MHDCNVTEWRVTQYDIIIINKKMYHKANQNYQNTASTDT